MMREHKRGTWIKSFLLQPLEEYEAHFKILIDLIHFGF